MEHTYKVRLEGDRPGDPADMVTVKWKRLVKGVFQVKIDYCDEDYDKDDKELHMTYSGIAIGKWR